MTFHTILAAASGGTASEDAIETACHLARRFRAHLEGFHVRADIRELLISVGGYGMPLTGEFFDKFDEDVTKLESKTKAAFEAALTRHVIPRMNKAVDDDACASWRVETGDASALVAARARFFDLVVLGRSERVAKEAYTDTIERTLLESGRPVLLAPAKLPASIGENIAFAWNGSPQAVRALTAALPMFAMAGTATIITIGKNPDETCGSSVREYLAWQGIAAKHLNVLPVPGVGPGQQLLSAAREEGADLLVMGGYGHRPWREYLFGGATHELVGVSLLPLLLMH